MPANSEIEDLILRVRSEIQGARNFAIEFEKVLNYFSDGYNYEASGGKSSKIDPNSALAFSNRARAIEDLRKLLFDEKEKKEFKQVKV